MGYRFEHGLMYRMPTHFGPATGPRQGEGGRKFSSETSPRVTNMTVSFLTNREQLEALLPEGVGLKVGEEPVVTVKSWLQKRVRMVGRPGVQRVRCHISSGLQWQKGPCQGQSYAGALGEYVRPNYYRA